MNFEEQPHTTGVNHRDKSRRILTQRAFDLLSVLVLCAPSAWLLASIPPLWRDADAYNQVTNRPVLAAYFGHGPLYPYLTRLPLWIGATLESFRSASPLTTLSFLEPRLTDGGVLLVILLQHAAFIGATWLLISNITRRGWVRFALAVVWTGATGFYTLAHCVGSETLSLICTILFVSAGVTLVRRERVARRAWIWCTIALLAALLSRYVNLWLVIVLPLTFLLQATWSVCQACFARLRRGNRFRVQATWRLQRAVLAVLLGVFCIYSGDLAVRTVCRFAKLRFHSRMGHTFLWRLQFLADLPEGQRAALLARVAAGARSDQIRSLVDVLRDTFARGERLSAAKFEEQTDALLATSTRKHLHEARDATLNALAWSFIIPPQHELLHEVRGDFARGREVSLSRIAQSLFETTAFYFDHRESMPACANLVTFRGMDRAGIEAVAAQHRYFRFGASFTYNRGLIVWLIAVALLVFALGFAPRSSANIVFYAVSLTLTGLLMMLSSCLLGELLPRYALPMWQLLAASLLIVLGTLLDTIARKLTHAARSPH